MVPTKSAGRISPTKTLVFTEQKIIASEISRPVKFIFRIQVIVRLQCQVIKIKSAPILQHLGEWPCQNIDIGSPCGNNEGGLVFDQRALNGESAEDGSDAAG